ncbi:hypothetical protein [Phenylobacterium sp. J367]|uniref:hypothetical protein n=1 Tax=Phenylobacterium sp. J367 TaxID=2898435 RepID=UPI0021518FC3|nr:hypothetical protein [Phenylobacterium sp. J367]MCR5880864.1 hypothetical protein [Phenylobacterium sp. J367]
MDRYRMGAAPRPLDTVIRRLRQLSALSDAELELVRLLGDRRERHTPGEELIVEGEPGGHARSVLSG